jgi:predicted RecB family nuclease
VEPAGTDETQGLAGLSAAGTGVQIQLPSRLPIQWDGAIDLRLRATEFVSLYRPSECRLRVYLRNIGEIEAAPGPFDLVLRKLGERHERLHLSTLGPYLNLNDLSVEDRVLKTTDAVKSKTPVMYQAGMSRSITLGNTEVLIVGFPDFLILDAGEYLIRDSKLARRIDEESHPEIIFQLQIYGWLFEQTFGHRCKALQVHSGTGVIVDIPYDGGVEALGRLRDIVALRELGTEPYEPVGTSKCGGCGFEGRCWSQAVARRDISLVMDIDQSLARTLKGAGINTPAELLAKFDVQTLGELKRPWGEKTQRVGNRARNILLLAEVLEKNEQRVIAVPQIPAGDNFVMFDLEGIPPYLDELEKIYLWGIQVFGKRPGKYLGVTSGFGPDSDKIGWQAFLANAKSIFEEYGDIPFVHWSPYEKTYLSKYVKRHGDDSHFTAGRVLKNLCDLHTICKASMALPLPSYGLKTVEAYVGFHRSQEEYGGQWAMAKFIEATETDDQAQRQSFIEQIVTYNEEDLAATWAVLQWLASKSPASKGSNP